MSSSADDLTLSNAALDAVIATYLQAIEEGQMPDRQDWLARYPELARELTAFFADLDHVDRAAGPLRLTPVDVEGNATSAVGTTVRYFGDYELLSEIARGGMGIVYQARQQSLNRIVALKMILAGTFASTRELQRFRAEAEAAANLDHPGIVPIYEIGEHEGQQYFSMKLIEGTSLASLPRAEIRTEVTGMIEIAQAVHAAHQHGVLHRDLKPSNILIDHAGTRYVTDFGLAKRLNENHGAMTETGQLLGTPRYMSPEQAAGRKDLTIATDVYSLGTILYERLTGVTPFTNDNLLELLRELRAADPPRPSTKNSRIDRNLETIVLRCLEKDPQRRYPSADAVADDLQRWLRGEPILARPVGRFERAWLWCRRNPLVAVLATSVTLSLLTTTGISLQFALYATEQAQAAKLDAADTRLDMALDQMQNDIDLGLLNLAGLYRQIPAGSRGDDLRWCLLANAAVWSQRIRPAWQLETQSRDAIQCAEFNNDCRWYAAADPSGVIRIWNARTGKLQATVQGNAIGGVTRLTFSPDGRRLAAAAGWVPARQSRQRESEGTSTNDNGLAFPPLRHVIQISDTSTGRVLAEFDEPPGDINQLRFSEDGLNLWIQSEVIGGHPNLEYWNIDRRVRLARYSDMELALVDEGPQLYRSTTGSVPKPVILRDGTIVDPHTGTSVARLAGATKIAGPLAWSPLNPYEVANCDFEKNVFNFWDIRTGQPSSDRPSVVDVTPDDRGSLDLGSFFGITGHARVTRNPNYVLLEPSSHIDVSFSAVYDRSTNRRLGKLTSRLVGFSADGLIALTEGGQAYDCNTWSRLAPGDQRRFHPAFQDLALMGRVCNLSSCQDLVTEKKIGGYRLNVVREIEDGILDYDNSWGSRFTDCTRMPITYLPKEPWVTDADQLHLWAQVLTCSQATGTGDTERLKEADWEQRRQAFRARLPRNASVLLTSIAEDASHWRRTAARGIADTDTAQLIPALDRLIELEPIWEHYDRRGKAYRALKKWDAAAKDFLQAGRLTGPWYLADPPAVLDAKSRDRLRLVENSESIIRNELKLGSEVVELVTLVARNQRRDIKFIGDSLTEREPAPAECELAMKWLHSPRPDLTPAMQPDPTALIWLRSVAQCQTGQHQAVIDVNKGREIDPDDAWAPSHLAALTLSHQALGHTAEARQLREQMEATMKKLLEKYPSIEFPAKYLTDRARKLDL